MKILETIANHHWTGPAEQVLSLAAGLQDQGHQVDLAVGTVPQGTLPGKVIERGLPLIQEMKLYRRRFAPRMIYSDIRWLKSAMENNRYDLIHCHHSHDHTLALLARGRRRKLVPIVRTVHHSDSVRLRRFQGLIYRPTDGHIAISDAFNRGLIENYHLDPDRVRTIRSTIDHRRFLPLADRLAVRREFGFGSDEFLFGIVSRIKRGRGHPEIIEAFARIIDKLPQARLLIIGRGEMRAEMEHNARRFRLADRIHFLGYLSENLPRAVGMLDVKVLLGEGSDGSCRAAVEALACGVPVLAASVGTMPETIRDGKTGWLLPRLNVQDLALTMLRAAKAKDQLKQMGQAARQDVEQRFTEKIRTRQTIEFFEQICGR